MAINIESQPNEDYKYPAWNDLNFVVSSTNTAQSGFKIVANVKVNGTTVQTLNLYTYPSTIRSYCNVNKIVQNYITDVYQGVLQSPSIYSNQSLYYVQVTFQEFYSDPITSPPELKGTPVNSDIIYVWRAAMSLQQIVDADYELYQFDYAKVLGDGFFNFLTPFANSVNSSFGNIAPSNIRSTANILKIKASQIYSLRYILNSINNITAYIRLGLYDSTKTRTFDTQISSVALDKTKMYDFAIGTDVLDTHSWDNAFTLDSNDKYFAILITSAITTQSKTYFFEIDWTPCNAYDNYEVHWLNRYGGFDSWVFDRRSKSQTEVNQVTHKNNTFNISSPTPTTYQRYVKPHFTKLSDVLDLNTNNLKVWEYEGLSDLFTSPEVYVKINDAFFSCVVQDKQTFQNYKTSDGVFNVNVKLKVDNNQVRQW